MGDVLPFPNEPLNETEETIAKAFRLPVTSRTRKAVRDIADYAGVDPDQLAQVLKAAEQGEVMEARLAEMRARVQAETYARLASDRERNARALARLRAQRAWMDELPDDGCQADQRCTRPPVPGGDRCDRHQQEKQDQEGAPQ